MQITLKIDDMSTDSLRGLAHALLEDASLTSRSRGIRMERSRQVKAIINELESRAFGGATGELREMVTSLDEVIER